MLEELIAKLEAATGPSIELDEEIRVAVGHESVNYGPAEGEITTEECYGPPSYTSSIDAALTLVPENFPWVIEHGTGKVAATIYESMAMADKWSCFAKTAALAICIAALKAHSSSELKTARSLDSGTPESSVPEAGMPVRIQRKRTKGWRMPAGAVYVGRGSKWGNPWRVGQIACSCRSAGECSHNVFRCSDAGAAVAAYHDWTRSWTNPRGLLSKLAELRGKNLACWCPLDQPCHADVLLELAKKHPNVVTLGQKSA